MSQSLCLPFTTAGGSAIGEVAFTFASALPWDGPEQVLQRSVLVNELTGERLRPTPYGTYVFDLEDGLHRFTWHLGDPSRGDR